MYKKVINKIIRFWAVTRIPSENKTVYLTFDDGPEPGITEFVLEELAKYDYKATFFCRGDNAEKNHQLLNMLRGGGHAIASHTYSHLHAYEVPTQTYIADVEKADEILKTNLFRPPHGSLTYRTWIKLKRKYKIVFWSLNSGDSDIENFNFQQSFNNLINKTQSGSIVLFHFCHRHENETKQLLPRYLEWLNKKGFQCEIIG